MSCAKVSVEILVNCLMGLESCLCADEVVDLIYNLADNDLQLISRPLGAEHATDAF